MSELIYRVSAIIVILILLSYFVSSDESEEKKNGAQNVYKTSLNQQEVFYADTFENNDGSVTFTTKTSNGTRHHYYGLPATNVSVLMVNTPAVGIDPMQPGEFRFKVSVGKSKSGEIRLTVWEVKE